MGKGWGIVALHVAVAIVSQSTWAGNSSSGGGGAYVCRDHGGNILSAQLVDLWESQNTPFEWDDVHPSTIEINYNNAIDVDFQVARALDRLNQLDSGLYELTRKELVQVRSVINYLPPNISIMVPEDLLVDYFPTGCLPEGMMRYNGTSEKLDVNSEIFSRLDSKTDIAASFIHEALYKVFRDGGSHTKNSVLVRRLVACLFSETCTAQAQRQLSKDRIVWFHKFGYDPVKASVSFQTKATAKCTKLN